MNKLQERIEANGIDYILAGDYYIPEISIPQIDRPIGHYGRLRKAYLKEFRPIQYSVYVTKGTLYEHLAEVNEQATEHRDFMMAQLMEEWGISEDIKANDQMLWVHVMNNARHSADEIIMRELIYV